MSNFSPDAANAVIENVLSQPTDLRRSRLFMPAARRAVPLHIAIAGPSGGGKTVGALRLAFALAGGSWEDVFVIQTETEGNILGYVNDPRWRIGVFQFWQMDPPHSAKRLLQGMKEAVASGAKCLVVDTFTHIWAGRGGVRDVHDKMTGNSYTNWDKVNPLWYDILDYLNYECPVHVVLTLRSKLKYDMEEYIDQGQKKSRPVIRGLEPIVRPETEYEFALFLQMDRETHRADIVTMRGSMFPDCTPGTNTIELTEEVGYQLKMWAEQGEVWVPMPRPEIRETISSSTTGTTTTDLPARSNGPVIAGVNPNVFWKAVYALGGTRRLSTNEVRGIVTELLPQYANQGAGVILHLLQEYNPEKNPLDADALKAVEAYKLQQATLNPGPPTDGRSPRPAGTVDNPPWDQREGEIH